MLKIPEDKFLSVIDEMCVCRNCGLHLTRSQVVPYRGDPHTNLMVIGEAPGAEEQKLGMAMVGRTGSYLVGILSDCGFPVESIYITNCIMCRPPENADPLKEQLDACSRWLNKHIEMVDPKVILAVGRFACGRIIPEVMASKPTMASIEGKVIKSMYFDGRYIIPIQHPSAILRRPMSKESYERLLSALAPKIRELIS